MKTKKRIVTNEQGKCPVCGNDLLYLDVVDAEDAGVYKLWKCHGCRCTGREYYEFNDHYDVYEADGETRVDDEGAVYRIKRDRLIQLLNKTISTLHVVTGEAESYETLYDLADEIGITEEEYQYIVAEEISQLQNETSNKEATKTDKFIVCMDSSFVRDSQMFDTTGLSDDEFRQIELRGEENENLWHHMKPMPFIAVIDADTEKDACKITAQKYRYDERCLFAQKITIEQKAIDAKLKLSKKQILEDFRVMEIALRKACEALSQNTGETVCVLRDKFTVEAFLENNNRASSP